MSDPATGARGSVDAEEVGLPQINRLIQAFEHEARRAA